MALGDAVERNGEHARTGSQKIDLDQADASRPQLLLLLDVQVPPGTGNLVRRAEHLDHRHNPPARLDVDDLDEPLPDRLGLIQVDHQRLGHRDAVPRPGPSFFWPAALDDPHIRDDVPALPLGWLDEDALAHSRQQVTRQVPLERIARIGDQTVMNIAPELLKVRVHPGKRTAHGRSLRRLKGYFPIILTRTRGRSHSSCGSRARGGTSMVAKEKHTFRHRQALGSTQAIPSLPPYRRGTSSWTGSVPDAVSRSFAPASSRASTTA